MVTCVSGELLEGGERVEAGAIVCDFDPEGLVVALDCELDDTGLVVVRVLDGVGDQLACQQLGGEAKVVECLEFGNLFDRGPSAVDRILARGKADCTGS